MLSDMGINVVEDDEVEEADNSTAMRRSETDRARERPARRLSLPRRPSASRSDRTDDPVRMYLREMGSVELLSREGEIAIAKRIEAGRETMIAGLCESPLTFQAIIIWRDELNEGEDPAARHHRSGGDLCRPRRQAGAGRHPPAEEEEARKPEEKPRQGARRRRRRHHQCRRRARSAEEDDDEDDEANLSLAAMEAELQARRSMRDLRPSSPTPTARCAKLQDQQVESRLAAQGTLSTSQERRYKELKDRADHRRSSRCRSTRRVSRRSSSSSTTSTSGSCRTRAGCCVSPRATACEREDFLQRLSGR